MTGDCSLILETLKIKFIILILLALPFYSPSQEKVELVKQSERYGVNGVNSMMVFNLDQSQLSELNRKHPVLSIDVPLYDGIYTLELKSVRMYSPQFAVFTRGREEHRIAYDLPLHYNGHIKGHVKSTASINVRGNKLSGVIRLEGKSYTLAYSDTMRKHYVFDSDNIDKAFEMRCTQLPDDEIRDHITQEFHKNNIDCEEAVGVYFECDHTLFLNFGSDSMQLIDYVVDLFAEVSLLYANENLPVVISGIGIWTSPDPYSNGTSALYDFQDELNNTGYAGDIAHLLANDPGNNGGVAYIDQLCDNAPYAYSDISNTFDFYPAYSWDVQLVAHEMGHTFGSMHTHDCVWGPDGNQQIDDCGNVHGTPTGICYDSGNPVIPAGGGTVMSYCHLDPVGIDFLNGFGPEPGNLMRQRHASCFCDNAVCGAATAVDGNGSYTAQPDHGQGASSPHATHADWFSISFEEDGFITISSCDEGVDTRVWLWAGTCNDKTFVEMSDDDCEDAPGSQYASRIESWPVVAGTDYLIEWDDRWSNAAFGWELVFTPADVMDPCDGDYINASGVISDTIINAKMVISCDAQLTGSAECILKAGESLEFKPGFELEAGTSLTVLIEDCAN